MIEYQEPSDEEIESILRASSMAVENIKRAHRLGWNAYAKARNPELARVIAGLQSQHSLKCTQCGGVIGQDNGPPDGWQIEDGSTICQSCCVKQLRNYKLYRLTDK